MWNIGPRVFLIAAVKQRCLCLYYLRTFFFGDRWPGVARQPLTFFASRLRGQKKSKQRKATATPCSLREFPFVRHKKWEMGETRYAQTTPISFSIFCDAQTAAAQAG
jgi:hypothetical protein